MSAALPRRQRGSVLFWTAARWLLCLLGLAVLAWPLVSVVVQGLPSVSWEFLTRAPADAGRAGGIAPMLVSTLWIVGISMLFAIPVAWALAILQVEVLPQNGLASLFVRGSLDVLAGVPSIVFGLFGLTLFCRQLGWGYSLMAGGAALACMILPTLARGFALALESLGPTYRMAGAALGLDRLTVLHRISIPVALPALTGAVLLALTRAVAETAVLLFTSGYSDRMPQALFDSGRSVSVHVYELATNVPGGMRNAYGAALVLVALLMLISAVTQLSMHWLQSRLSGCGAGCQTGKTT
ncbi:phosphate ABC transporter permease PstA [Pelomonas sp. APW6]|uniref:Phosphate transport system permease protein PstA n=1 Tax=Roseateles subflavus TaxID=3053353 RepID=A0ABT7LP85_9BURK|nr:phosphate ABC transporter permease PstA [Pelomonas sp. APW6]MDL5034670.1 phosphate ABC transporter permease PstA [Pelomonas sp. APW6]